MALRTWTLPTLPKATIEDSNDNTLGWTAQHTAGPTNLSAYSPTVVVGSRTDTCGVTSGSSTVTDVSVVTGDFGKEVTGPGIPPFSYVGTVSAGTSFVLSSNANVSTAIAATATNASASLKLGTPAYSPFRGVGTIPSTINAPTIATSTTGGTGLTAATTYTYVYTYTSVLGESVFSAAAAVTTGAGGTNSVTVTPAALPWWANGVNIYGRVAGSLVLLRNQANANAWVDAGTATGTQSPPAGNQAKAWEHH